MVAPRCLILGRSPTPTDNMEEDSATALLPCHDKTLTPACCGFSEHPAGHQPWSESPSKHTRVETAGQPAPCPEVAQEQGEGLGSCEQKRNLYSFSQPPPLQLLPRPTWGTRATSFQLGRCPSSLHPSVTGWMSLEQSGKESPGGGWWLERGACFHWNNPLN